MEHRARHMVDTQKGIVKIQWLCNTYFIYKHMDFVKFSAHINFNHLDCQYNMNNFEMPFKSKHI